MAPVGLTGGPGVKKNLCTGQGLTVKTNRPNRPAQGGGAIVASSSVEAKQPSVLRRSLCSKVIHRSTTSSGASLRVSWVKKRSRRPGPEEARSTGWRILGGHSFRFNRPPVGRVVDANRGFGLIQTSSSPSKLKHHRYAP